MTQQSQPNQSALAASFAEHVRGFHRSLAPEEQALLERVFALAEMAAQQGADTEGYFLKYEFSDRALKIEPALKIDVAGKVFADEWLKVSPLANKLFGPLQ